MRPSTKEIIRLLRGLPDGSKVLDVGCGTGRELKKIVNNFNNINFFAIDTDDARKFLPEKVLFKTARIEDIDKIFPNTKFDLIICQHVLEHILYPLDAMKIFNSSLNRKGVLVVESPSWIRLAIPFHRDYFWNDPSHIRPYTKKSLKALCLQSDFYPLKIVLKSATTFKSAARNIFNSKSLLKFIKNCVSFILDPFLKENIILIGQKNET